MMGHCPDCMTPMAVHDDLFHELSVLAGRPIFKIKDLYNNEIENILRAWYNWRQQVTVNNFRGIDYGVYEDTRGSVHSASH